jgi:Ribbon-helix-helix protein, copG family
MRQDEREEYGEEPREIIEGLRRLGRHVGTPSDLAPTIFARGDQLLPPQKDRRARWWTVVAAWRPHPLAWGPVVAMTFFIAGVFVPWPHTGMPRQDVVSEERSAPAGQLLSKELTEVPLVSPAIPSQALRPDLQQRSEPSPPPPELSRALARRAPIPVSSSVQIKITATLPAELYEQLQQEAERRRVSLATILREAVEAYAQSPPRQD